MVDCPFTSVNDNYLPCSDTCPVRGTCREIELHLAADGDLIYKIAYMAKKLNEEIAKNEVLTTSINLMESNMNRVESTIAKQAQMVDSLTAYVAANQDNFNLTSGVGFDELRLIMNPISTQIVDPVELDTMMKHKLRFIDNLSDRMREITKNMMNSAEIISTANLEFHHIMEDIKSCFNSHCYNEMQYNSVLKEILFGNSHSIAHKVYFFQSVICKNLEFTQLLIECYIRFAVKLRNFKPQQFDMYCAKFGHQIVVTILVKLMNKEHVGQLY